MTKRQVDAELKQRIYELMLATVEEMIVDGKHVQEQLARLAKAVKTTTLAWQVLADDITKHALAAEILNQLETLNGVNKADKTTAGPEKA